MSKKLVGLAFGCLLSGCIHSSLAEVIAIDAIQAGTSFSADKTKTFLWAAKNPKATLIFIPGGEGHLGLADDKVNLGGFYGNTLRPLSDPNLTAGLMNVVVFDSPYELPVGTSYPSSRATADHLKRIESVVLYYKDSLHQPIWLMGHSNGAVSVTEFYKYLQEQKKEALITGMVYSSARNGADFNSDTSNLPVLFLAHEKDGCQKSTIGSSRSVYEDLKRVDKAKLEYVLIKGGRPEGEPCRSGYHMFNGASEEAYRAIDGFISPYYK